MDKWALYYELEPFGQARTDWGFGQLASLFYNANRGKGDRPLKVEDFYETLKQPVDDEATVDSTKELLRGIAERQNAGQ